MQIFENSNFKVKNWKRFFCRNFYFYRSAFEMNDFTNIQSSRLANFKITVEGKDLFVCKEVSFIILCFNFSYCKSSILHLSIF